jgi:hypothetical protein
LELTLQLRAEVVIICHIVTNIGDITDGKNVFGGLAEI